MVNLTLIMAYIVRIGVSLMIKIKDLFKKLINSFNDYFLIDSFLIDYFFSLLIVIIYLLGVKRYIHDFTDFQTFIATSLGFVVCILAIILTVILDFFDKLRGKFDDNKK